MICDVIENCIQYIGINRKVKQCIPYVTQICYYAFLEEFKGEETGFHKRNKLNKQV